MVRDRRDALDRWQQVKSDGLTAQATANAVGVSRATLYRWRNLRDRRRLAPQSRRPHHLRQPAWSPDPNGVVEPAAPVGEPVSIAVTVALAALYVYIGFVGK